MGYVVLAAVIAELASISIVASHAGWLWTMAALGLGGLLGMSVLAGRGVSTLGRASAAMQGGDAVAPVVVDGALVALAGVLLIVPGFLSDAVAVVLLVPPLRALVRGRAVRWLEARVMRVVVPAGVMNAAHRGGVDRGVRDVDPDLGGVGGVGGVDGDDGDVIDTTATEVRSAGPGAARPAASATRPATSSRSTRELP